MSQIVPTLVAPPTVQTPPLDAPDRALRSMPAPRESVPFSRPQKETLAGWIAGIAFGLVCIGAGVVVVIAVAVMGLALAVGHLVGRWIRIVAPRVELVAR